MSVRRVTSLRNRALRDAQEPIRKVADPPGGDALKRIGIGVAITVVSAALIAVGSRIFRLGS